MTPILTAKNIVKTYTQTQGFFSRTKHTIHALDDVSITIERGKTTAVVGESGSGKSTLAKSLIKLIDIDEGVIQFNGENINQNINNIPETLIGIGTGVRFIATNNDQYRYAINE